jgi:superfamily I DNA/RNA helicase
MEWPFVVVLGAHDGLMPHALADDIVGPSLEEMKPPQEKRRLTGDCERM